MINTYLVRTFAQHFGLFSGIFCCLLLDAYVPSSRLPKSTMTIRAYRMLRVESDPDGYGFSSLMAAG